MLLKKPPEFWTNKPLGNPGRFIGPARRAQKGPDEPPLAIEYNNGLKAILVVIGIEQAQLLMAMHRVERIIDIKHDPPGRACKRLAVKTHHIMPHPDQRARIGQVLHPRDRGLGTQGHAGLGAALQSELEAWVMAQADRIVAVFIASGNHHDPEPDDVAQDMLNLRRIAWIAQAIGEPLRQTCFAFDLAQQGQPGIRTHVCTVKSEQDRLANEG